MPHTHTRAEMGCTREGWNVESQLIAAIEVNIERRKMKTCHCPSNTLAEALQAEYEYAAHYASPRVLRKYQRMIVSGQKRDWGFCPEHNKRLKDLALETIQKRLGEDEL